MGDARGRGKINTPLSLTPPPPRLSFRRERGFQITHDLLFSGERKFLFSREIRWGDLFHLFQFQGRSIINFCQKRSVAILLLLRLKEPTSQINNASEPVFPQQPGNSSEKNQTWLLYRFYVAGTETDGPSEQGLECVFYCNKVKFSLDSQSVPIKYLRSM